ncbi:MAG: Rne/Rng family ribonuclease [Candidatus Omnitrophica bacterium]|nr:Rne/Rng family ribonuclease [Candidatus Omnitrophota bacterium]
MSREILIQTQKEERLVAIIEDGRVDDFYIEVDRYQSLLGNIYKGKVESILPSINAAFVNIGEGRNGFLYLTDAVNPLVEEELSVPQRLIEKIFGGKNAETEPSPKQRRRARRNKNQISLKVGQEILVQVVKDPFGEKGARLTTHLTLPGRFVVYMPCDQQTGISKKIENAEERLRLREVIKSFTFAKTGGFIIRTASLKQGKRELIRDAKFLYHIWVKIYKKAEQQKAPALIYEEGELTWKIVRDYLTEKVDKLIIDSEEEYQRIRKFVQTLIGQEMVNKIQCYQGSVPLFEAKHVSKDLQSIYDTHVYCKSGAYIVINPTEGLTVVDVNSGKFRVKASPGDAAFMVNMEVVPEIARQLRLRDLGGIIVIDFIDMVKEDHKRKVLDALEKALARDHAKTEVGNRISSLGLVEMTRARTGKTIESISFGKCPFCDGRGRVKLA